MPTTGPRYDSWNKYRKQKDAEGDWLCVWCGKKLRGRQRKYCGSTCRHEVEIRCGVGVRQAVFRRDKGRCGRCGVDAEAIEDGIRAMTRARRTLAGWDPVATTHDLAATLGLRNSELGKSLWEAHHIEAVADGGGACGLEGYETLCIWCHKKETAGQAATAAHARHVEKQDKVGT